MLTGHEPVGVTVGDVKDFRVSKDSVNLYLLSTLALRPTLLSTNWGESTLHLCMWIWDRVFQLIEEVQKSKSKNFRIKIKLRNVSETKLLLNILQTVIGI